MDVDVAAKFARDAYRGLRGGAPSPAAADAPAPADETAGGGGRAGAGGAAGRGAAWRWRLDLDVSAPNVLLQDPQGSLLTLRMGRLMVRDAPCEGGRSAAALHLEHVGAVLRRAGGEAQTVMEDAEVTARLEVGSGAGAGESEVDGRLDKVAVRVSPGVLEVLARVWAPWAADGARAGAAAAPARRELLRGRVLLRGLRRQEGWAWRRVRLHAAAMHVLEETEGRCDAEAWRGAVEETLPLEGLVPPPPPPPPLRTNWTRCVPHPVLIGHAASLSQVVGSDVCGGQAVVVLQRLEDGGTLALHAGEHHAAWLARVRAAQKRLDPYRDWGTPFGARPGELMLPPAAVPHPRSPQLPSFTRSLGRMTKQLPSLEPSLNDTDGPPALGWLTRSRAAPRRRLAAARRAPAGGGGSGGRWARWTCGSAAATGRCDPRAHAKSRGRSYAAGSAGCRATGHRATRGQRGGWWCRRCVWSGRQARRSWR